MLSQLSVLTQSHLYYFLLDYQMFSRSCALLTFISFHFIDYIYLS